MLEQMLERIAVALERSNELAEIAVEGFRRGAASNSAGVTDLRGAELPGLKMGGEYKQPMLPDWDPREQPVMAKYGKEKRVALEHVAKMLGIEFTEKSTGVEIHQAIVAKWENMKELPEAGAPEAATGPEETTQPPATEKVDEFTGEVTTEAAPEAEPHKIEDVRAALRDWLKAQGAKNSTPAVELIKAQTGKASLAEVDPADYGKIMDAMSASTAEPEDMF